MHFHFKSERRFGLCWAAFTDLLFGVFLKKLPDDVGRFDFVGSLAHHELRQQTLAAGPCVAEPLDGDVKHLRRLVNLLNFYFSADT